MKTLLTSVLSVGFAVGALAQGQLNVGNNLTGFRAPVYGPDTIDPTLIVHGQTSTGTPTGSTTYTGALLNGTGFTFALFAGPNSATDPTQLSLVTTLPFRSSAGGALPAGLVTTANGVTVANTPAGTVDKLDLRAWDNKGGTVTTWAQVLADPTVNRGSSGLYSFTVSGGNDAGGNPVGLPTDLTGFQSFNIHAVPEPTSLALLGLGGLGMLLRRRQK